MLKKENNTKDYFIFYLFRLVIASLSLLLSWLLIVKIEFLNDMWFGIIEHFTGMNSYEDWFEFGLLSLIYLSLAALGIIGLWLIYWGLLFVSKFLLVEAGLCKVEKGEMQAKIVDRGKGSYRALGGEREDIVEQHSLVLDIEGYKKNYRLHLPEEVCKSLNIGQEVTLIESTYVLFDAVIDYLLELKGLEELELELDDEEYEEYE